MFNFLYSKKQKIISENVLIESKMFTYEHLFKDNEYAFTLSTVIVDDKIYLKVFENDENVLIILMSDFISFLQKNLGHNFIVRKYDFIGKNKFNKLEIYLVL